MIKTLIYFPPEYKNLALKIRENYIEHHHGEVDLVSETDQNDIEYARKEKYDEAIFIENIDSVVIHDINSVHPCTARRNVQIQIRRDER